MQRTIGCSSKTVNTDRKQLLGLNLIQYDSRGKLHITPKGKDIFQTFLVSRSRSDKNQIGMIRIKGKNDKAIDSKARKEQKRREYAYILLSIVAALGNHSYERTNSPAAGDIGSFDIKTGRPISMTGTNHIPGVGLSDFAKNEKEGIQATLDRRKFVIYNEAFAYLDFATEEIQEYIYELMKGDGNPILKEITISDYKFLSYSFDIDRDDPNFITLIRDGARVNRDQAIHREDMSEMAQDENNKIIYYHDFYCDKEDENQ